MKVSVIAAPGANSGSLLAALQKAGLEPIHRFSPGDLGDSEPLVLCGVGTFGSVMSYLRSTGFDEIIRCEFHAYRKILGICVGMQVFFQGSNESANVKGLGLIPGHVERLKPTPNIHRVPTLGFEKIHINCSNASLNLSRYEGRYFYFMHSYGVLNFDPSAMEEYAVVHHTEHYLAAVRVKNVVLTQFHPERSHSQGLDFLKMELC